MTESVIPLNELAAEDFELAAKYARQNQKGMACHHAELGIEAYKRAAVQPKDYAEEGC